MQVASPSSSPIAYTPPAGQPSSSATHRKHDADGDAGTPPPNSGSGGPASAQSKGAHLNVVT